MSGLLAALEAERPDSKQRRPRECNGRSIGILREMAAARVRNDLSSLPTFCMGGQVLLGPEGVKVETKRVVQHPKRDTDLVEIDADGGPRPFKITKNHLIAIVDPCPSS